MPRVTISDVQNNILSEHYFTGYEGANAKIMPVDAGQAHSMLSAESLGLITFCIIILKNGFSVIGYSVCADPAVFSPEVGRDIARENAFNQIWPLMGYELKTKLQEQENCC